MEKNVNLWRKTIKILNNMKKNSILAALLLLVTGMQSAFAQKVVLNLSNGEKQKYEVWQLDSISFEEAGIDESGVIDGREFIDLGLPSGTLWATVNVGAETPEGYGGYFAWGETETKDYYSWSRYKFYYEEEEGEEYLLKYCIDGVMGTVDNKTVLEAADDVATAKWGDLWQMPLYEQIEELKDTCYTTIEWTFQNEVAGIRVTSKVNGNSIFLPAAGEVNGSRFTYVGEYGFYWSRSLYGKNDVSIPTNYAERLLFNSDGCFPSKYKSYYPYRDLGHSVRPVLVQSIPYPWPISQIELNYSELLLDRTHATEKLIAYLTPSYAKPRLIWESSDENVAQVGDDGLVTVVGEGTCTITCRATDGKRASATCQVTVSGEGTTDGHEWVDLGLPSGTLWATCNLGAESPGENGSYYAWGETEPKEYYSWETYKYCEGTYLSMTKYNVIGRFGKLDYMTWLKTSDDAAYVNWGSNWQMPSEEQLEELMNSEYTTVTNAGMYDTFGKLITSKINGRSIFLPMPGHYTDSVYSITRKILLLICFLKS